MAWLTGVTKVQPVGAASLQRCGHFLLSCTCSSTRVVRPWLVLLACLAQLWIPAQSRHAPAFATHTIAYSAAATGLTIVSVDEGQSGDPCPLRGPRPSSHDSNGPSPCDHENCPCCACLCCCSLMHTALGILPQETARAVFAPLLATIAVPPAFLGALTWSVGFAGQPRAPPILI